jgi:hypothetical protein
MFNLYAYAGNYVKLYDESLSYLGCYGVTVVDEDPNVNYEKFWIGTAFTSNLVGVYADCGCTGRTELDIVREEPGVDRLFFYSALDCATSATTYSFKSTNADLLTGTTSYKIYNTGTTETVCIFNPKPTFIQNTNWVQILSAYTDCQECEFIPPSPTPTQTPSNTPTPSITPTISLTPSPTPTLECEKCMSYSITASENGIWTWLDCDGILRDVFLLNGETYFITCQSGGAQEFSPFGSGTYSIVETCYTICPSPTPTSQTPTPTTTLTATPSPTPTNQTPTPTSQTPTPTPTPTSTPSICTNTIYSYGNLRPNCSDYCTTNYNINTIDNSTQPYASLSIGDFVCGYEGDSGYLAYSNVSTDTNTGPFRIADIDGTGEVLGIYVCSGGSCIPL